MLGGRLRQARRMANLTLEAFAKLLTEHGHAITKQALSKYENEDSTPPAKVLLLAAQLLGVPNSYFVHKPKSPVSWLGFRRHTALSDADEATLKAYANDIAELQIELQTLLYPNTSIDLPAPSRVDSVDDAERVAAGLRAHWELDRHPIGNLVQMAEAHQVIVIGWSQNTDSFDGLSGWCENYPVTVVKTGVPPDRLRFTLAHELGHLLMETDHLDDDTAESLVNRFAASLLVPPENARHELGNKRTRLDWDELGILKRKYGLSMAGWIRRASDLDIITAHHAKQLQAEMRQKRWLREEPVGYNEDESPLKLDQMAHRATAESLMSADRIRSVYPKWSEREQATSPAGRFTIYDLMALPQDEQQRVMAEAFALAAHEEFETFEDTLDMDFTDAAFTS